MILHAASTLAVLVDQIAQAPVVVQCAPTAPEQWWKSVLQVAQTIIPVAGGVWIAWMAFRWNKIKEHEQWVLDHKMEEWRDLLKHAAEIQRVLRMETLPLRERANEIADKLKHSVHELSVASASCVFLQDFFADPEKRARFYSFMQDADEASVSIGGLMSLSRNPDPELTQEERSRTVVEIMQKTNQITGRYLAFCEWLRKEAAISLRTEGCAAAHPAPTAMPSF